jgi:hypothetical protein
MRRKRKGRSDQAWRCPECQRIMGLRFGDRVKCGHCGHDAKRIHGEEGTAPAQEWIDFYRAVLD